MTPTSDETAVTKAAATWELVFIGTGSYPNCSTRALASVVLEAGPCRLLFDCADGTIGRLMRCGIGINIDLVLLSDTSSQEVAGLAALAEVRVRHRALPVRVLGPAGSRDALAAVASVCRQPISTLFQVEECSALSAIEVRPGLFMEPFSSARAGGDHGFGWIVHESPLRGRFDGAKAKALGIRGSEFAQLERGERVRQVEPSAVLGPPRPGRRVVVTGRTRPSPMLRDALRNAQVAVLAAPFMDERLDVAEAGHALTGWEAAENSSKAGVSMVLLTQLGSYSPPSTYIAEARQFHRGAHVPLDGQRVSIPLPDRGAPHLVRKQPPGRRSSPRR